MTSPTELKLRCLSATGEYIADLLIVPSGDRSLLKQDISAICSVDDSTAIEFGETPTQLCEGQRYEYEVHPYKNSDLRLRCSLAKRRTTLRRAYSVDGAHEPTVVSDAGIIETGTFCGSLLLEIVDGDASQALVALASTEVTVRSVKLNYRSEFRGMLTRISNELVGLLVDSRSSAKIPFVSTFEERGDKGWLQLQLELLRVIIENPDFDAALYRITSFPHERLQHVNEVICPSKQRHWDGAAVKALTTGKSMSVLPNSHPLRKTTQLETITRRIPSKKNILVCDTPENRVIKYILNDMRSFLTGVQQVFDTATDRQNWRPACILCQRLQTQVETWLDHAFFRQVENATSISTASPVLQRKGGYRELLRWWLQFRTTSAISWTGSDDLFKAGQRDVATLYEYWVFFELLDWFCITCRNGVRPEIEELVDGLDESAPSLKLKKRRELGPFEGSFNAGARLMKAKLSYNRRFSVSTERHKSGSWTRNLHPDYTLSFWPADFSEEDAERLELLVHIHFDAKYRIDDFYSLFGSSDELVDESTDDVSYKREDLLKMHAYRDAIKRSQGAYVIYPGGNTDENIFKGFHEILPGLGAFGLSPNTDGTARGLNKLTTFLQDVLLHLASRTTAQERVGYHIARSYNEAIQTYVDHTQASTTQGRSVEWNFVTKELDERNSVGRAVPPDEHFVLLVPLGANLITSTFESGMAPIPLTRAGEDRHIATDLLNVKHVLAFDKFNSNVSYLFEVTSHTFSLSSNAVISIGSDLTETIDGIVAMMPVKLDDFYDNVSWDIETLYADVPGNELILKRVSMRSMFLAARQKSELWHW